MSGINMTTRENCEAGPTNNDVDFDGFIERVQKARLAPGNKASLHSSAVSTRWADLIRGEQEKDPKSNP
jgi:hypothetical protein